MAWIEIEVVYGLANRQKLYRFRLPENTTVREAVFQAPIQQDFPDADLTAPLGVFGKMVKDDYRLKDGDRVECYRPLIADAKVARRQRAAKKQVTRKR